jgi:hypothetical protein
MCSADRVPVLTRSTRHHRDPQPRRTDRHLRNTLIALQIQPMPHMPDNRRILG